MHRGVLIALAGLLMVMGCSQANSSAEHQERKEGVEGVQEEAHKPESPAKLAKYRVTEKKTCQIASQTTKCYTVSSDAESREHLTALTEHFRDQSADVDAVMVTFFFDKPNANSSGEGFAFYSREAARNILSETLPRGVNLNQEVNMAMQNDGTYVLTLENLIEQEACKDWDPRAIGPPPKQWDCPGY